MTSQHFGPSNHPQQLELSSCIELLSSSSEDELEASC
jgi:hypothetical protein